MQHHFTVIATVTQDGVRWEIEGDTDLRYPDGPIWSEDQGDWFPIPDDEEHPLAVQDRALAQDLSKRLGTYA